LLITFNDDDDETEKPTSPTTESYIEFSVTNAQMNANGNSTELGKHLTWH